MTDVAGAVTPIEPMPPIPLAPDVGAEIDAAPPEAPEAAASAEAPAERALPFDVEHLGVLRRAVLDHLVDTEGPQSVAQILAAMPPGTTRGSAESAIKREFHAGRIERVAAGTYRLAPPPKPKPPPPPPEEEQMWFDALEAWLVDSSTWDVEKLGLPPDHADTRVPPPVKLKFVDRIRKREERRKDAEAAAARRAAADRELRDRLIAGCFENVTLGAGINDLSVIKAMLADGVPLEHILIGLKRTVDRRIDPRAAPIASWRDERFLRAVARCALLEGLLPKLVETWKAAGTAPAKPAGASGASPAVQVPAAPEEVRPRLPCGCRAPPGRSDP
jgi:hypothetical protein